MDVFLSTGNSYSRCSLCGHIFDTRLSWRKLAYFSRYLIIKHLYIYHSFGRSFFSIGLDIYISPTTSVSMYDILVNTAPYLVFICPFDVNESIKQIKKCYYEYAAQCNHIVWKRILFNCLSDLTYICVFCDKIYEQGLPAFEVVLGHIKGELKFTVRT